MPTPRSIPAYRPRASARLPPAKLALFRSVVSHPPPPFAVASAALVADKTSLPPTGPHQVVFSTSPRPLIPLTTTPTNHLLWNPPAADAKGSRVVELDESGRLARFASRFSAEKDDEAQFAPEADLSFLEGETLQSPGTALGKRDIVGNVKSAKKGKK